MLSVRRIARAEAQVAALSRSIFGIDLSCEPYTMSRRRSAMLERKQKIKESKYKMLATEGLIRKVRAGELDVKRLKRDLMCTKDGSRRKTKDFVRQLELLAKVAGTSNHDNNGILVNPDAPDDEKKILMINRRKQNETWRKEGRLLMDVMIGKRITREHSELLRKEYLKLKAMQQAGSFD